MDTLFTTFFLKFDAALLTFISSKVAVFAATITPWAEAMMGIYVVAWGLLMVGGRIQEPFWDGIIRILTIIGVISVGLRLWLYQDVFIDTFYNGPGQLAAALVGASDATSVLDKIWFQGNLTGQTLWDKAGALDFGYYLAAVAVYAVIIIVCGFLFAVMLTAKIVIGAMLTIGPLPIVLLFFKWSKRFFELWIAQLANSSFVIVLLAIFGSMLLSIVLAFVTSAATSSAGVTIAELARMTVITIGLFLVIKRAEPLAAGLSGGMSVGAYDVVGGLVRWGAGTGKQAARGVVEGAAGSPRTKYESVPRLLGNLAGSGVRRGVGLLTGDGGSQRPGGTISREHVMPLRRS